MIIIHLLFVMGIHTTLKARLHTRTRSGGCCCSAKRAALRLTLPMKTISPT